MQQMNHQMREDEYRTIMRPSEGLYKEKGSKFIALAFPVSDADEANTRLVEVRKKYHDARHHCYAYRIGAGDNGEIRMNDDGEPSGTAGRPIFGQIESLDLTHVMVIVVRYFGGVKLGTGGLTRAYKTAAREALDAARTVVRVLSDELTLRFAYPLLNDVMRVIKEEDLRIAGQNFAEDCMIKISVRKEKAGKIKERFCSIYGVEVLRTNKN